MINTTTTSNTTTTAPEPCKPRITRKIVKDKTIRLRISTGLYTRLNTYTNGKGMSELIRELLETKVK